MRKIQSNHALARPDAWERQRLENCLLTARSKKLKVRVEIGIGETNGRLALRVLGYAKAVTDITKTDLPALINPLPIHIRLFSSGTKLDFLSGSQHDGVAEQNGICALVTLAEALRINGCEYPISIDLATRRLELPLEVESLVSIPSAVKEKLHNFQSKNNKQVDCFAYALEHSPMFEDVGGSDEFGLRIFIGGRPEGVFWTVRRKVRAAAANLGIKVNPMLGLVMFGLWRPWYHTIPEEPVLADILNEPIERIADRFDALVKVHHQIKRECLHAKKSLSDPRLHILAQATVSTSSAIKYAEQMKFEMGDEIQKYIKRTL